MCRLRLPRRPSWTAGTAPDELDANERTSFYDWRRDLAGLEQVLDGSGSLSFFIFNSWVIVCNSRVTEQAKRLS